MKNNTFEEIWEKLKKSKRVLMSLHAGPDGDSLGSCTAMKYVLERDLKKEVILVSVDRLPENFNDFAFSKEIQFGKKISDYPAKEGDVFLCLDFGSRALLDKVGVFPDAIITINIDHHRTNEHYGKLNYVALDDYSTCSVLLGMFKDLHVTFDTDLSTRLLLGICTDSGFFTHDTLLEKALGDASFLMSQGGDYRSILRLVLYNTPLKIRKLEGKLFERLEYDEKFRLGYACLSQDVLHELEATVADVKVALHSLPFVKEFDFIFTLVELDGSLKGSFRTNKRVNVMRFAQELGGGGHVYAAGFELKGMTLEKGKKHVLAVIETLGVEKVNA